MSLRAHERYGQHGLTPVDRFGVWLSKHAIHRHLPSGDDLEVSELGCGYRATQSIALERKLKGGIGVDFQIAPELQTLEKFTFYEGTIEQTLPKLESETVDFVMLISVLEDLVEPQFVIESAWRMLRRSLLLLVNLPTWIGKRFLELSAFRFRFSSKVEIDDHKMYYDKRAFWLTLVRAGFKPSQIRLRYHKFGFNLFAAAGRTASVTDEWVAYSTDRAPIGIY